MKLKAPFIMFIVILLSHTLSAKEISEYKNKLLVLGSIDQQVRTGNSNSDKTISADKTNLEQLKSLIDRYGFPTIQKVGKQAHVDAFLIAQHAVHELEFMEYFRNEMKHRLGSDEVLDKLYAYLLDRTNQMKGLKQVYGTQGRCVELSWVPNPVESPSKLAQLRKEIGLLSLSEFSKVICETESDS